MTEVRSLVDTSLSRVAACGVAISRGEQDGPILSTSTAETLHQHAGRTFDNVDDLENALKAEKYITDRGLATTLYLMLKLRKPLLLEGEAGVGKTEIAKVLSAVLDTPLIRLQCYEGLDASAAIYEWDYPRQMLYLQTLEATGGADRAQARQDLFSDEFLLKRPLLQAIDAAHEKSPVLLIDEVDRADQELEAFLLELLSDFQVTVPELGTIRAEHVPIVILTSNRTREIHDALKRRCLYYWIDFPTYQKEYRILGAKVPEASESLRMQICAFTQGLREVDLFKPPGMAETLDWANALLALGTTTLSKEAVEDTLGVILKYQEDVERVQGDTAGQLVERATRATAG
ncbi:MAG: MoxR family ATPase [Thermomicrobiales bacterium]|nr:MoxR family ATPase [Thermomicrobiales bacterium]